MRCIPTSYFQIMGLRRYEKSVGMHLILIFPTTLACVLFGPTTPTYFFNLFTCFLYLFVFIFLSSIATESEGCGLVHSLCQV